MASSSRIVGWRRSVLNVARALLLGAIGLGPATPALAQAEQATAALGIGANHGSLSFAPWEQIDTFTGNVLLSFSDVDLPGPAGFNLTIRRHYNGKVGFYPSFDLGFPVVATRTTEDSRVIAFPLIVMPDGRCIRMLRDTNDPTLYRTTARWQYHASTRVLETPDGVTYHYDADDHPLYKEDAFGNRIDAIADPGASPWRIGSLVQQLGNDETRTVSLGYTTEGHLSTVTANGRTWTYLYSGAGSVAIDPTGATWTLTSSAATLPDEPDAHAESFTMTTPTGGWVRYLTAYYDECPPPPPEPESPPPCDPRRFDRAIRQRDAGGADVTASTLHFTYEATGDAVDRLRTSVTKEGDASFEVHYEHDNLNAWWDGPMDGEHQLAEIWALEPNGRHLAFVSAICLVPGNVEEDAQFQPLSRDWFALPIVATTTVGGRDYVQEWTQYSCTFGQPLTVQDRGDFTRTTTYAYQSFNGSAYLAPRPTSITSQGLTTTILYDVNTGFVTSRTAAGVATTFADDGVGNVASRTVAGTQTTTFDHDRGVLSGTHTTLSDVTMAINWDGSVHTSTQVGRTTQEARTTTYAYDDFGRLTSVQSPLGSTLSHPTETTYATDHAWVRVGRGTAFTQTCVDGLGRTKATIATAGQRDGVDRYTRSDIEYDGLGRVVFTSLPYETLSTGCALPSPRQPGTTFEHDAYGRVTRRTNPDATYATMDYTTPTGESPRVTTTDEKGRTTTQIVEASGSPSNARRHTVTDAAGRTTTYGYDAPGNLVRVVSPTQGTAPTSVTREWAYDANNRLDHQIQPESGTVSYQYDGVGRLWKQFDAFGRPSTFAYDDENRLTGVTSPDPASSVEMGYDEWGNRTHAANGYATTDIEYDGDHRLTRRADQITGRTFESRYQYDPDDQLTDVWYPSGNHVAYDYDHGRLARVYDTTRNLEFATGFVFHPSGGLASYTTGNGVVHTTTYDARYRTDHIGSRKTSDDDVLGLTYGYDAVGHVTSIQDHRGGTTSATFDYDDLDRLTTANGAWGSLAWEYDVIGNRLLQTKNGVDTHYDYTTTNHLDHTSGGQAESFTYDAAGLLRTDGRGSYWYTPNSLQEQAEVAGATTWYRYDADGQRVRKVSGSEVSSTDYVRGPLGVLSEFEGAGDVLGWSVDYIYAAGRLIATTKPPTGAWHTIAVTTVGGAGTVTSSPTGVDCGPACTGRFTRQSAVTLTATPGPGQTFTGWSGACSGASPTITVTVTGDLACTAWFSTNPQVTVTTTGSGGGTVTSAPGGISCPGTCTAAYAPGIHVTLTATPEAGSRFAGWSGDCSGPSSTATVTLDGARACTATFTRTDTLSVGKSGDGAFESLVTSDPVGVSCGDTCTATYDADTSVTLNADAAEGYEFQGWSGAGCGTGTVTMDQARNCTAEFAAPPPTGCEPEAEQRCQDQGGRWDSSACLCDILYLDPLAIALDGRPVRLTGLAGGVSFDLDGDGVRERVAWTVAGAAVGFLALDRDGDGGIDHLGELFGQTVSGRRRPEGTANSFLDLAAFDRPEHGGDGDGLISAADAVFVRLRLWVDRNHDGVSQPGELLTLAQAGIDSIELSPQPIGRRDAFGNVFRYRAIVHLASGRQTTVWDVFLVARTTGGAPASAAGLAWPGASRLGPLSTGLVGLGAGLIAIGLTAIVRPRRRRHPAAGGRDRRATVARVGATAATTVAVVLLWPATGFGQAPQVVEYYDVDAVGSVRAVTDAQGQVVARHDFLPFGEELNPQSPPHDKRLYTGQERDFETGQDYFGARYYRADLARFSTIDPGNASASDDDPQSWNAYAYARNNPLRYIDPDGRAYQVCAQGADCSFVSDASWEGAMGNAGGDYVFRNGYMWALVNGKWSYAGTYEQVSIDSPQINFVMMVQTAGVLADRWLRENAKEMAIGSALSGVGGVVSGALSGGLAVGGTAGASGVTDLAVVTAKGARYANYATKLTAREFQSNLLAIGYKIVRQGISSNGPFTVLSSGEKTFTIYAATSTGGASVQVRVAGQIVSKIRLGGF